MGKSELIEEKEPKPGFREKTWVSFEEKKTQGNLFVDSGQVGNAPINAFRWKVSKLNQRAFFRKRVRGFGDSKPLIGMNT